MIYRLLDALPMPSWPFIGLLLATAIVATLCIEAGRRMYLRHKIRELESEAHETQALLCAYVARDEAQTKKISELGDQLLASAGIIYRYHHEHVAAAQECVELKAALSSSERLVDEQAVALQAVQPKRSRRSGVASSVPTRPGKNALGTAHATRNTEEAV
jgi:hypothetical protein